MFGKENRLLKELLERVSALESKHQRLDLDNADLVDRLASLHGRINARIKAEKRGDGEVAPPPPFSRPGATLDAVSAKILARRQKSLAAQMARSPVEMDEEEPE